MKQETGASMTELIGGITNETLVGGTGTDLIFGRGGADTVNGGAGSDILYGDSKSKNTAPKPMGIDIVADATAKVTFITESAGYRNTLGMYVVEADGTLSNVQLLFANASLKGSGGDLLSGVSNVAATLKAGQTIGFFVAPDAFSKSQTALTAKDGRYELRDSSGKVAKISDGGDIALYHVDNSGIATVVNTASGTSLFFTNQSLNGDGLGHTRLTTDPATGLVRIGFEDLWGGGDRDFDDVVFTIDVGKENAAVITPIEPPKVIENRNDVINAGAGDDQAFGNTGNDRVNGEDGNDLLDGGSGNDTLTGGRGNDSLYGRSGDDALYGDDGDDLIEASSGNDRVWDGAGNDKVYAGTGRDTVYAGLGDDFYNAGDGFDIVDFSASKTGLELDVSKKTAVSGLGKDTVESFEQFVGTKHADKMRGDKNANTFVGGDGDDWFRGLGGSDVMTGGAGKDIFAYSPKDTWFEKEYFGLDRIRDFNLKEDKLDFFEITKNDKSGNKFDLIKLEQADAGVIVWANLGVDKGEWQQIVQLDGLKVDGMFDTIKDWLIV
jgi:serralysin